MREYRRSRVPLLNPFLAPRRAAPPDAAQPPRRSSYIYIYIYDDDTNHTYYCTYIHTYIILYIHIYTHMILTYMIIHISHICIHMYIYIYILCVCVYIYIYIYRYTHIHTHTIHVVVARRSLSWRSMGAR